MIQHVVRELNLEEEENTLIHLHTNSKKYIVVCLPAPLSFIGITVTPRERGIPCQRGSQSGADKVPALCTHTQAVVTTATSSPSFTSVKLFGTDYETMVAEIRPRWLVKVWQTLCMCVSGAPAVIGRVFLGRSQTDVSELMEAEKCRGDPETPAT